MARASAWMRKVADFFARDTRIRSKGEDKRVGDNSEDQPHVGVVSLRGVQAVPTLAVPEKAVEAGDLHGAIAFYRTACGRPGGERFWVRLGELYQQAGQIEEALAAFETGFRKDPSAREAFRRYLFLRHANGSLNQALPILSEVAEEHMEIPEPWNYLGVAYFMGGQPEKAAEVWQRLIERFPRFSPARTNYASYLIEVGRTSEAMLHLRLAADLEPAVRDLALNNMAEIHIQRGEYNQALRLLQEAARHERGRQSSSIWTNMGHCYQAMGQLDEAIRAYREGLQKQVMDLGTDSDRLDALTQLAKLYLGQGRIVEAEKTCVQAFRLGGKGSSLFATYGQALLRRGRYEEAAKALRQAAAAHPNNPKTLAIYKSLALAYYKQGQFLHATSLYKLAKIVRPEPFAPYDPEVLALLDQENADDDTGDQSLEQFIAAKQAAARQPDADPQVRESLADALYLFGRLDEAIEQYRSLLDDDPGRVATLVKLGAAYLANDQPFLAYSCFNQAIERDTGYAPAHIGAGMVALERGSVDTAIVQFRLAALADPSNAQAFNLLGNAYQIKGLLDEAILEYRRAIAVREDYAQAYDNLGAALMAKGEEALEEAAEAFEKAVSLRPQYAKAWRHLGSAREKLGDTAGAIAAWRTAAQLNPYDIEVTELLKAAGQSGMDRRSEPR